jgi:hypothetical protein
MFYPENLNFTMNKGENGPHEVTYELPTANDAADLHNIVPYWTDFELYRENEILTSGMLTSAAFQSESEALQVAGKSWLHYLEKRQWPFDPMDPLRYKQPGAPRGVAWEVEQIDVAYVVEKLLTVTLAEPNSLPITGYQVILEADRVGRKMDYRIDLADTESILSKISSVAQQEPGIFDFWIDNNKVFHKQVPRRYTIDVLADATLCQWAFTDSASGLLSVSLTDNGPEGTHLVGYGAGDEVRLGLMMDDPAAQNKYRRLDASVDFGDVPNRARVNALTRGHFGLSIQPQIEVVIEVWPDAVRDFWEVIYPGCAIWLQFNHEAYNINSAHEVVSMDVQVDLESNESVTLNLNQVYPMYEESTHDIIPGPGTVVPMPPHYGMDPVGGPTSVYIVVTP